MAKPTLISVVGQTATGKTSYALKLANKFFKQEFSKAVLLSADSKQVFQGLEILTGADLPNDFKAQENKSYLYRYFAKDSIEIHGVSIVPGDAEWSVAHFEQLFRNLYDQLDEKAVLIVVGGTGLYHQQIFNPAATTHVKPDQELRTKLEKLSLAELQQQLQRLNPQRWRAMNNSDQQNPRRLIRAIEIAGAGEDQQQVEGIELDEQFGLQLGDRELKQAITERVDQRLEQGVIGEVKKFEQQYPANNLQAKASLGYEPIINHLNNKITLEELKKAWIQEETQYARRQQIWWQKKTGINWSKKL